MMQKLNNNCNIHEYEPNRLALKIISETNNKLKLLGVDKKLIIQEMNKCLYHNFLQTDEVSSFSKEVSVRTINKSGSIAICSDLYLSAEYPKGKLTEEIFENMYKNMIINDDIIFSDNRSFQKPSILYICGGNVATSDYDNFDVDNASARLDRLLCTAARTHTAVFVLLATTTRTRCVSPDTFVSISNRFDAFARAHFLAAHFHLFIWLKPAPVQHKNLSVCLLTLLLLD